MYPSLIRDCFLIALGIAIQRLIGRLMPDSTFDLLSLAVVMFGIGLFVREYEVIPWLRWWLYRPYVLDEFLIDDEDSYNRSSDGAFVELKRYKIAVKRAEQIPGLSLQVIAFDPPVPGVTLPMAIMPFGAGVLRGNQEYTFQHFYLLNKYRINREQVVSELFMDGKPFPMPPAQYSIEVTAHGEADWNTRTVWLTYDGTQF